MKSISFVICLIMFCALQWSTVNCRVAGSRGNITLPTEYNLGDRDDNKLMASKTEYIYNDKGEFEDSLFYYDKELKDCKLNIYSKKISCVFKDEDKEYSVIFDTTFKSKCKLNEKTEFVKADLYALNTKKQYGKYSFILHYETENDEIVSTTLTAQKFVFFTKDQCELTVKVTNYHLNEL